MSFYRQGSQVAKKRHVCEACRTSIDVGDRYVYESGICYEAGFFTSKTHEFCHGRFVLESDEPIDLHVAFQEWLCPLLKVWGIDRDYWFNVWQDLALKSIRASDKRSAFQYIKNMRGVAHRYDGWLSSSSDMLETVLSLEAMEAKLL